MVTEGVNERRSKSGLALCAPRKFGTSGTASLTDLAPWAPGAIDSGRLVNGALV